MTCLNAFNEVTREGDREGGEWREGKSKNFIFYGDYVVGQSAKFSNLHSFRDKPISSYFTFLRPFLLSYFSNKPLLNLLSVRKLSEFLSFN